MVITNKELLSFKQLDDGRWYAKDNGKYGSGLTFVVDSPDDVGGISYYNEPYMLNSFNINFDGDPSYIIGYYGKNKSGTDIFIPTSPDSEIYSNILLRINWGGQNNPTRGIIDNMISEKSSKDVIMSKYCPSNNGKMGCSYILVPRGFSNIISFEDI